MPGPPNEIHQTGTTLNEESNRNRPESPSRVGPDHRPGCPRPRVHNAHWGGGTSAQVRKGNIGAKIHEKHQRGRAEETSRAHSESTGAGNGHQMGRDPPKEHQTPDAVREPKGTVATSD
ncbi:unnamed protein product [Calypogeia fissa]